MKNGLDRKVRIQERHTMELARGMNGCRVVIAAMDLGYFMDGCFDR